MDKNESKLFTPDQVKRILDHAAQRYQTGKDSLSLEELLKIAEEAGIPPEQVHASITDEAKGITMQISTVHYAGFWKRFVACFIDFFVCWAIGIIITFLLVLLNPRLVNTENSGIYLIGIVMGWLYYALMESSDLGATLGKMVMGIKVTDLNGEKISFGRATGRYFGKFISSIILYIGYAMAGFTAKKQGLHDMMAGCLVVNK